jgi:putative membrane protein
MKKVVIFFPKLEPYKNFHYVPYSALSVASKLIDDVDVTAGFWGFALAGLIFSLANSLLKPIFVIVSLPAILLTLGLFIVVVNGILVYITFALSPGISMSFGNSIITGIILSLVNYIVNAAIEIRAAKLRS